jgi:mannosylglycoprotein endo-beta-mannosidase
VLNFSDGGNELATYGVPRSLEEYCEQAQVANYVQYRALLEGWGSGMWARYSGVLLWKSANPWPGLRGQLYDWWGEATGGYFGVRSACEAVHVQLNLHTHGIELINNSLTPLTIPVSTGVNRRSTHTQTPRALAFPM